ncbi:sulfotransferase-like domain-containing protein [Parasphingorhabdus cellanae]|uniref:HAD family hydrolase n=1 Tax=Parasphingorhabdus cellanae TaxID=2806553 RepID=A0ABX7T3V9_9SPHN|nr:HAD family hydrolase [Parasphingorhabdus cellanae]QTD56260.1 HAD family hydrolase [Parasphingorhabdus cellanae]
MTSQPVRIAMWSGPRNISTAMMRSFGSRSDCAVTDEPFYGAFLKKTGFQQPMADQIIASMDCDWTSVKNAMRGPVPEGRALWYQKHMPHHMVDDVSIADFPDHRHAFLIRNPEDVVASYAAKRVEVTADDLGYERQVEYLDQVAQLTGTAPIVMDSAEILQNPEAHLQSLCTALDISWDPAMLSWKPGPRDTDGIWASHWYNRVLDTTSFAPPSDRSPTLTHAQQQVADQCRKFYNQLLAFRLKIL